MKRRIVQLGVVGVDSGQIIICDPCYIDNEFKQPDSEGKSDHAHDIYRHKDGSLWQFTYGNEPQEGINKFPGTYDQVIPKYGKAPNDLVQSGEFEKTDMDPTPHIPKGEFSYRGICKVTQNENHGGQLNYALGHAGAAIASSTGFGDGLYPVFAEIVTTKDMGERVRKVWIEFL